MTKHRDYDEPAAEPAEPAPEPAAPTDPIGAVLTSVDEAMRLGIGQNGPPGSGLKALLASAAATQGIKIT